LISILEALAVGADQRIILVFFLSVSLLHCLCTASSAGAAYWDRRWVAHDAGDGPAACDAGIFEQLSRFLANTIDTGVLQVQHLAADLVGLSRRSRERDLG
jgi:hypothetical protein